MAHKFKETVFDIFNVINISFVRIHSIEHFYFVLLTFIFISLKEKYSTFSSFNIKLRGSQWGVVLKYLALRSKSTWFKTYSHNLSLHIPFCTQLSTQPFHNLPKLLVDISSLCFHLWKLYMAHCFFLLFFFNQAINFDRHYIFLIDEK